MATVALLTLLLGARVPLHAAAESARRPAAPVLRGAEWMARSDGSAR